MLRKNGTAAIPSHIQQALKVGITSKSGKRVLCIRKGDQIVSGRDRADESGADETHRCTIAIMSSRARLDSNLNQAA